MSSSAKAPPHIIFLERSSWLSALVVNCQFNSAKQRWHCERNIFGGTANFDASISYGLHTSDVFCAALSMPLSPSLRTRGRLSLYKAERDLSRFASCWEALKGARASIRAAAGCTMEIGNEHYSIMRAVHLLRSAHQNEEGHLLGPALAMMVPILRRFSSSTEVNEVEEDLPPSSMKATDEEDIRPRHYSTCRQKAQTSLVISVDSSSSEDGITLRTHPAHFRQSHHDVVVSDKSESQQPRKKRQLVKGKRPQDPELEAEDEDGNLIDEVDEDHSCMLLRRDKKNFFLWQNYTMWIWRVIAVGAYGVGLVYRPRSIDLFPVARKFCEVCDGLSLIPSLAAFEFVGWP
ncbi:hypothetical protein JB92DRAFT_2831576 [Gautieria morchelliformis]|nr:hypothetical protein JB92DRAFT_2831576 [Gautieria morchelliformis]